jgi:hypothetical protein
MTVHLVHVNIEHVVLKHVMEMGGVNVVEMATVVQLVNRVRGLMECTVAVYVGDTVHALLHLPVLVQMKHT